ncbi:MAG: hypothetical protein AMJ79_08250 [Phycisphaerae bacterium SM23_30]|nr:MAG: hypothetical protein AMJ79_08250 [Phycisphaerae bacterium SM23_30]
MATKSVSFQWCWDLAGAWSLEADRKWILSAMGRHGESLVALLWRILGNEQDVCDAYQETFLKLAHHQAKTKPKNIKAYLFRSASNVAISMLRKKNLHLKACKNLARNTSQVQKVDYLGDLDGKQLQQQLRCYIMQLPDYLRNVVILHDLGEMSYQQVGPILGISMGTARVYRCRALQWLAARLADRKEK